MLFAVGSFIATTSEFAFAMLGGFLYVQEIRCEDRVFV